MEAVATAARSETRGNKTAIHDRLSHVAVGLGLVALALSFVPLFVRWTRYHVPDRLTFDPAVQSSVLYSRWPQLFYSRDRHLRGFCFPDMNDYTCKCIIKPLRLYA